MQSDVRGVTQMFEQCVPRQRAGNSKCSTITNMSTATTTAAV